MKLSKIWLCALVGLAGLVLMGTYAHVHAQATIGKKSKAIIDPAAGETIDQLQQTGIASVTHFASAFEAQKEDRQLREMQASGRNRAGSGSSLDRIELRTMGIDTSLGEPTVPAGLRQGETSGKRLRLIQFKGPMKSVWLDQVKAAGDVTVISYIPNNAYILWLDSSVEQKLAGLMNPQGLVRWIGAYHPYYKIPSDLMSLSGTEPIKVRVAVVDQSQDPQSENGVFALGVVKASLKRDGQEIIEMAVPPSAIARIARLPDVLWIERQWPMHILDEVQDLVLAGQTNQLPFFSPTAPPPVSNGVHYLDFLTNAVGGGMLAFFDDSTYPVVDVADTGVDNGTVGQPYHPSFYIFGEPSFPSRIIYGLPPWLAGNPVSQLGCTTRLTDSVGKPFRSLETADLDGHGTMVASILAGFDLGTNIIDRQTLVMRTSSNTVAVLIPGPLTGTFDCSQILGASTVVTAAVPNGVTNICGVATFTNITFTVTTNTCPAVTNVVIAFTRVDTDTVSEVRQDANGFQYGMGVSPFGPIGVTRLWGTMESSAITIGTRDNACQFNYLPDGLCLNDFVSSISEAYIGFARIQNNSWAKIINTTGDNGGIYDAECQTFDTSVRDAVKSAPGAVTPLNQEFIVVFACNSLLTDAGNQGNTGGFADMRVTSPATAKNVISVGSSVSPPIEDPQIVGPQTGDPQDTNLLVRCPGGGSSLDMYILSEVGPTVDGRFKPEIVATGAGVVGAMDQLAQSALIGLTGLTTTNCSFDNLIPFAPFITNSISPDCTSTQTVYTSLYMCGSGSSFAAPAVSGAIQLLWWYFQHRLTNEVGVALEQPSPAMAKAYLCNSARYLPVANPATGAMDELPSNLQGMGELDLARMFDGVGRVIRDESSPRAIDVPLTSTNRVPQQTFFSESGQSYEVSGQIQSNGLPFRVTLAWIDPPGPGGSGPQLVNDLDLEVTVGGVVYKGNHFSEDHSVTGGTFDKVNNMESVFLPSGQTGTWKVVVTAADIAGKGVLNVGSGLNQDFALVVYNAATNTLTDVPNLGTNNACQTALPMTTFPFAFTNGLNKAVYKNTHPSPTAGVGGIDEFFKVETPDAGITFNVDTSASSFNTVLSVWRVATVPNTLQSRGECGALEEVVSEEILSTNGGGSSLSFTADGSNTYFIVVEPQNNGDGGTMVLNVNVSGTGIVISPSALDFGDQITGTTSTPQTVSYQMLSNRTVTINSLAIVGSNPSDFRIDTQTCNGRTLANGASCFVNIDFTPQAVGLRQATLVITDTITGSPRLVPLSGVGTPIAPIVCLSSGGPLVFPSQLVTTISAVQSITITNCGSSNLTVASVSVTGFGSNDFVVTQDCVSGSPIVPGGTCTINVAFAPQTAGTRQATLTVTDNAAGGPSTLFLQGDATPLTPAICFGSSPVNFGTVFVSASSAQSVIITNCGTAPLAIGSVIPTGANASDFSVTSIPCTTVAVGGTCAIGVTFAPTATGVRTAQLTINDNTASDPDQVSLTGIGSGVNCLTTITLTPAVLPAPTLGTPYNQGLTANGAKAPVTFFLAIGPMPPGLALSTSGVISGTPTKVGQFSFEVGLTDANNCGAEALYTVFVSCPTINISPNSLPGGAEFVSYGPLTFTAFGGTPPYTFSQTAGSLPAGMTISSNGVFSGTPTSPSSTFTVTATDSNKCTASKVYTLTLIDPSPPSPIKVSPSILPAGVVGRSYTSIITASGGTAPYTFTAPSGSLPGGLVLSPAGALTGVPSAAGAFSFTVMATDSVSIVGQTNCTINVTSLADLAVSSSLSSFSVTLGSDLTCSVTVTNLGPSPATGVTVSNSLPAGAGLVSASAGCVMDGDTLVCNVGDLAAHASIPLTYTVTNTTLGLVSDTTTVTANESDPNAGNNSAVASSIVAPPFTIASNPKAITNLHGGTTNTVSVTLRGAGTMEVHLLGGDTGPIDSIVLTGTDASSALTIQVKRGRHGDGLVNIGSIVGGGSLRSINGRAVNVTGAGIQLGGSLGLGSVTLRAMIHSALTVAGPIKTVNVGTFDASNITAVKLGSVRLGTVSNSDASPAFGIQVQKPGGTLSVGSPRMRGKITTSSDLSADNFHVVVVQ